MTEDKKHDDKDRKKVSDEELEDVAGGSGNHNSTRPNTTSVKKDDKTDGNAELRGGYAGIGGAS